MVEHVFLKVTLCSCGACVMPFKVNSPSDTEVQSWSWDEFLRPFAGKTVLMTVDVMGLDVPCKPRKAIGRGGRHLA